MANPFPFVAGDVLTAAELNGIGEYEAYTPTFTNLTVGNGTLTARFCRVNELVNFRVKLVFGSTTSIGGGNVSFTPPVTVNGVVTLDGLLAIALYRDTGTATLPNQPVDVLSSTALRLGALGVSGSTVAFSAVSATVPFTWTTNDFMDISGTYEAA